MSVEGSKRPFCAHTASTAGPDRAIVLSTFQYRGVLQIWLIVQQMPTGADGGCLDIFFARLHFPLSFSQSLKECSI